MKLVRLDENYLPYGDVVEGYTSLIWTERYQATGEFELKSYAVDKMRELLPEETLVSHLGTQEVMMVETVGVSESDEGVEEITIKGRTLDLIFDMRTVQSNYGKKRSMRKKYSATSAACVLVWNHINNASGYDVSRGGYFMAVPAGQDPQVFTQDPKDKIPNIVVSESVAEEGEARWWQLEAGNLYPQLLKILVAQDLGIRILRPVKNVPANIITVNASDNADNRGTVIRTATANVNKLQFNIFKGRDLSNAVKFSYIQGHFKNPIHLRSKQIWLTGIDVRSGGIAVSDVYRNNAERAYTGLRRRMGEYDAGSPQYPQEPQKPADLGKNPTKKEREDHADAMELYRTRMATWNNRVDQIKADFKEEADKEANKILKDARPIKMFSADISDLAPYKYKNDYFLGDKVTLLGSYGQEEKMIVAEYIQTEDSNGERGVPSLVEPSTLR